MHFIKLVYNYLHSNAKNVPIIKRIPAFHSIPPTINPDNIRFYKLSNLVLTLGMFVHLHWIFYFYYINAWPMSILNILSVGIYILSIILNRGGNHFTSSIIMVLEIILHQIIAVFYFGVDAGFQYYILVISLFPCLMPRGKWAIKLLICLTCVLSFIFLNFFLALNFSAIYHLESVHRTYLNLSNTIFSFISLTISGVLFSVAMHDTEDEIKLAKQKSDALLMNILPYHIIQELQHTGKTAAQLHENITIMFTDFKDFTLVCEELSATDLVKLIDHYFKSFDQILAKYDIEKIKTIGDAYMCVSGLQTDSKLAAKNMILCALEILAFVNNEKKAQDNDIAKTFDIRIGINTGSVIAGVVGETKFAYDIWGDAVNVASRMEKLGEINSINLTDSTYQLVHEDFKLNTRGAIEVKNKGLMNMYSIRPN